MSKDCYDWEENHLFNIEVALAIYKWEEFSNKNFVKRCAFIEKDNEIFLPYIDFKTTNKHCAEIAVELVKKYIGVDIRNIDIMQIGFFDPIKYENRNIVLCYKTIINDPIPIHKELKFIADEQLQISKRRIRTGHYSAFREGIKG